MFHEKVIPETLSSDGVALGVISVTEITIQVCICHMWCSHNAHMHMVSCPWPAGYVSRQYSVTLEDGVVDESFASVRDNMFVIILFESNFYYRLKVQKLFVYF